MSQLSILNASGVVEATKASLAYKFTTTLWSTGRLVSSRAGLMVAIGVLFLVLYTLGYARSIGEQTFNSPRENVGYLLSERFAGGHGFRYPLLHYDELPEETARALTPRDAAEKDGYVLPKDFVGTMLFYAPIFVVAEPLVLIVTPLFAVLSAFVLAKIADELFDRRVGLVSFCVWLAYPALFVNSSYIFMSDTIALFSTLASLLLFLRFWRDGRPADFVLMTAMASFGFWMRYPNVAILVVLLLALLVERKITWRHIGVAGIVTLPFVASILLFNQLVYGSFSTTGFHLGAELIAETANFSKESFFKFRPEVISGYLDRYVIHWPIILGPQIAGLVVGFWLAWRSPERRGVLISMLCASGVLTFYYLPQDAWGWTNRQVSASLLRYMLPALALWTMFAVYGAFTLQRRWRAVAVVGAIALIAGYGWTTWSGPGGVRDTRTVVGRLQDQRDQIIRTTEPDAVIATRLMDKVLFPERQTLTMTYLLDNKEPLDKGGLQTWQFVPPEDRFATVAIDVHERGIPMYLLADFDWRIAKEYDHALQERGYRLRNLQLEGVNFFKVVRLVRTAK